ncbi:MAG: hypothetical protein HZA17_09460 [Nitrospirae bacterium]|nr:hypothetical protein [Nitrospirota bacterium]
MIRTKTGGSMVSLLYKPLCILSLLFSLFGLIWLRSNIVTTSYNLRTLEEKKMESLKDMKMLLAERAKLMSIEKIDASFRDGTKNDNKYAGGGYIFPERIKVVHVKRNKGPEPYKASLTARETN